MARLSKQLLPWCAALVYLCLGRVQAVLQGGRDRYVFRGDDRDPETMRKAGGFGPVETSYDDELAFSLHAHIDHTQVDSAYVSTSESFGISVQFALTGGWVYRIHRLANMIDANVALPDGPALEQQELAALGGVPWDAVEGYWRVPESIEVPSFDEGQALDLSRQYAAQYEGLFMPNPQFNYERYRNDAVDRVADENVLILATVPNPDPESWATDAYWEQLRQTALRQAARRFLDTHGSAVGWREGQDFPLALWQDGAGARTLEQDYQNIDWAGVSIPQELQDAMSAGLPTALQCTAAITAILNLCRLPKLPRQKRAVGAQNTAAATAPSRYGSCEKLLDIVQAATARRSCGVAEGVEKPLVRLCKHDRFGPPCQTVKAPIGECVAVPPAVEGLTSVRPNLLAGKCSFYDGADCTGDELHVSSPGLDLYSSRQHLNDKVKSLRCHGPSTTVNLCEHVDYKGLCEDVEAPLGECVGVPHTLQNAVSSYRLEDDSSCSLFMHVLAPGARVDKALTVASDGSCAGASTTSSESVDNLFVSQQGQFDDKISSLRCTRKPRPLVPAPPAGRGPSIAPRHCRRLEGIRVWLSLGNGFTDGTWSRVSYTFNDLKPAHFVASAPGAGSCFENKISALKAFGAPTVRVQDFTGMLIWDSISTNVPSDNYLFGGDGWTLAGLRIDAQCSGSRQILSYRKYMKLDLAVSHKGGPYHLPKPVFRANISPTGWVVVKETKPFCKTAIIRDET